MLGTGEQRQVSLDDDAVETVVYKSQQETAEQLSEGFHRIYALHTTESKYSGPQDHQTPVAWAGGTWTGKDFHLADEIRYIQRPAPQNTTGAIVTVGQLMALFSTDTGDAWLLDADRSPWLYGLAQGW